jgi:AraC-like DNA-binding protein
MHTAAVVRNSAEFPSRRFSSLQWSAIGSSSARPSETAVPEATALVYQGGQVVKWQQKSWTGVSADIADVRCDDYVRVDLRSECTRLSVMLEEVGGRVEIRPKPWRGRSTSQDAPRPLSLIPAGSGAYGQATGVRFIRHLMLQFDGAALARMLEDEVDFSSAFTPRLMFSHPGIMHLAHLFAEECASGEPKSQLYGDTLSIALVLALSRLNTSKSQSNKRGQLAPWQIRRVTEYFAAHLAEDVQLQTVCDLVKLSRSYFSRAFKTSTGLAPHQWLLQARIGKAKQLLLESDLPLAQIAVDIGFADQAHFTRTFGRVVGQSPRVWQRTRCAGLAGLQNARFGVTGILAPSSVHP